MFPARGQYSFPGSSTYFAPGIRSARKRDALLIAGAPIAGGSPHHERRRLHAPQDRTDVGSIPDLVERQRCGGRGAVADALGTPSEVRLVVGKGWCFALGPRARRLDRPPIARDRSLVGQERLLRHAHRVVRRPCVPGLRAVEDECAHAIGVGRSEVRGERSSLGFAVEDGPLRADGIEHRSKIVGAHLEVGRLMMIGQARPALVEQDQAREG